MVLGVDRVKEQSEKQIPSFRLRSVGVMTDREEQATASAKADPSLRSRMTISGMVRMTQGWSG
jgi:hypothetical protein